MNYPNTAASAAFTMPATAEVSQGEVSRELEQTQKNLEGLRQAINSLELRLSPVVAERRDENAACGGSPEPVRVAIAQTVYSINCVLNEQTERLQSLLSRIEL